MVSVIPEARLPLSAKPKWIVPRLFKWLSIISFLLLLVAWVVSRWATYELEKLADASLNFDPSDPLYKSLEGFSDYAPDPVAEADYGLIAFFDSAVLELAYFLPSVAFLWLVALAVERLDDLVWINCDRDDQEAILQRRQRKKR